MPNIPPAEYTDQQLDDLSQVTPADIQAAVILWMLYAPPIYKDIINAPALGTVETLGGNPQVRARFFWDQRRLQYYDKRAGRYIPPLELRRVAIEPFINRVKEQMRSTSAQLQARDISLGEWQAAQMQAVKHSQIAAGLVANGGTLNTTEVDYIKIASFVLAMFLFLRTFVNEIKSGIQKLNGLLLSRTALYAAAARDSYEEMRRHGVGMYTELAEERRVLDPGAHHCQTVGDHTGCPELAAMGWQPVGVLPRIYDTPCGTNCRCHWEFR